MGLDITAYRKLAKIDALFDADNEPVNPTTRQPIEGDYFRAYVNDDFPDQAKGVDDQGIYSYGESFGHRAGSYGWYNAWREQLAKLAGYSEAPYERVPGYAPSTVMSAQVGAFNTEAGPFHELVCFSDCEGVIGATVSAKLARDFAEWDDRAKEVGGHFYDKYCDWRKCFEMAADGGAVDFH